MNNFHLAFKVKDIESTRRFYVDILGCTEGRSTADWIDFDFYGHQLSAHVSHNIAPLDYCGKVDGVQVPIPHFGCLLSLEQFSSVQERLQSAGISFVVKPQVRYKDEKSEQRTMFVLDFSDNPIEFKAFKDPDAVFSR